MGMQNPRSLKSHVALMGVANLPILLQLRHRNASGPRLLSSLLVQGTFGLLNRALTIANSSSAIEENPSAEHQDHSEKFHEIPGLGARLSLVLREIESIERKKNALQEPPLSQEINEGEGIESAGFPNNDKEDEVPSSPTEVEISHPWPEWIELVDRMVQGNYFIARHPREDDDIDHNIRGGDADFKVLRALRNACRRFGRERFDILRFLSPKDIQVIVRCGCPNLDGKVVTSAKRLRAYVHLDEGDVCSTCNLRGSCGRAYIIPRRGDNARTIDVMRLLLTYAHDPLFHSIELKLHLRKMVKASVRKLLKQVVELSATSLDTKLPKPVFEELPTKMDQAQLPPRRRVGRDDIEMKKGDWLCPTCDFMNFAKNKKCLQCNEVRPKGKLNPGEWECPGCNFVNYRRNMACYKCECNRPKEDYANSSTYISRGSDLDDDMRDFERSKYTEWKWKKPVCTEEENFDDAGLQGVSFDLTYPFETGNVPFLYGDRERRDSAGIYDISSISSQFGEKGVHGNDCDSDYCWTRGCGGQAAGTHEKSAVSYRRDGRV